MRSCLIQLLILVAVVFALLWFGLPIGASWLATTALNASGFSGTDTKVEVSSNPPPLLLLGHADSIHLTSSQVGIGDLHAATVDLTLGKVELFSRQVGSITGTLRGVRVAAANGQPVTVDSVTLSGTAVSARAEMVISMAEAENLAESQLKAGGVTATVALASPDKIAITSGGKSLSGHVVAKDGSLLLVPDGNSMPIVTLMGFGSGNPFQISSVTIGADHMTLIGMIDMQALLGI